MDHLALPAKMDVQAGLVLTGQEAQKARKVKLAFLDIPDDRASMVKKEHAETLVLLAETERLGQLVRLASFVRLCC